MRYRRDGFTASKRRKFLKTLAKTGCISDAAKVARISTTTVDRWRNKDARFAALCDAAIDKAGGHIETLAWERAVTGIEETVIHYGKVVGTRIKRSDSIFRMLLMASNRKKYGRMGAVKDKAREKELRKQIEREIRARIASEEPTIEQVREDVLARIAAIRAHRERQAGEGEARQHRKLPPPDEGQAGPGASPE